MSTFFWEAEALKDGPSPSLVLPGLYDPAHSVAVPIRNNAYPRTVRNA